MDPDVTPEPEFGCTARGESRLGTDPLRMTRQPEGEVVKQFILQVVDRGEEKKLLLMLLLLLLLHYHTAPRQTLLSVAGADEYPSLRRRKMTSNLALPSFTSFVVRGKRNK